MNKPPDCRRRRKDFESPDRTGSEAKPKRGRRFTTGLARTDSGLAERFSALHGDRVRYCWPWQKWHAYGGRRWRIDDTGAIEQLAKITARSILHEAACCEDDEERKALRQFSKAAESAARRAAMLTLARSEQPIPLLPAALDSDPWLFNVENGTLHLRTGELRPQPTDRPLYRRKTGSLSARNRQGGLLLPEGDYSDRRELAANLAEAGVIEVRRGPELRLSYTVSSLRTG